jgi:two-component system sensor histidine kinase HydH
MNILLADLRDHEDFGSAIENTESLRSKVVGVAAYAEGGDRIYAWGATPETWTSPIPQGGQAYSAVRLYLDRPANDSIALLFRPFRTGPPASLGRKNREGFGLERGRRAPSGFLFTTLIIFIRTLLARNAGYRRRIEEQKSLVVLGTAASTLAHEIKNPLLSIRLQTRILEKTQPGAQREIGIINDEVERLSALSHRVGDYLRDPGGNPRPVDPSEIALEVGTRLCGRDILRISGPLPPRVDMDPERLRSVLENLVRNALEADGPEEDVSIEVGAEGGSARIDVLDRGSGLSADPAGKAFDPFFTTKSRGTGIGLSVCKRFVAAAGGTIALEERQGGGCRARVILPRSEASA